jgi:uncharacterized membrane protein HdeD (DUF308 family)
MNNLAALLDALGAGVRYLGIASIVLGVLAMIAPVFSGAAVLVMIGLIILVAGLVRGAFGWQAWSAGKGPFGIAIGGLAALCGLVIAINPVSSLSFVTAVVAIYLAAEGISQLLFALRLVPEDGWPWVLGDAVLSILLGAVMWTGWPVAGVRALGLIIGVKLVSVGAVMVRIERTMARLREKAAALHARSGGLSP